MNHVLWLILTWLTSPQIYQRNSIEGKSEKFIYIYVFFWKFAKNFSNSVIRCRSQSFQNPIFDTPHSQMKVSVKMEHFCIGNRKFERLVECNVHTGRKWSHACLLSVFTGGFGGDRFYLKYWRSGLGKLLTFGGLG